MRGEQQGLTYESVGIIPAYAGNNSCSYMCVVCVTVPSAAMAAR